MNQGPRHTAGPVDSAQTESLHSGPRLPGVMLEIGDVVCGASPRGFRMSLLTDAGDGQTWSNY